MSVLALQLPPRERLGARAASGDGGVGAAGLRLPTEWGWAYSADGQTAVEHGRAALALLPRADAVVLVLADADVSWHRIEIPRAPPARLRAALLGVMEESLLEDDEMLHFALGAGSVPGQTGWVAVTHRPRLASALAVLEAAGLSVERVAASAAPGDLLHGHFHQLGDDSEAAPWLTLAGPSGVACLRMTGGLARALLPESEGGRWTATPGAAAAAERWLAHPVTVLTESQRLLDAAAAGTNLRQFDLTARHRGTRALRDVGRRFLGADWRPVRAGLAALVVLQLVGLNADAWRQRRALEARRTAMSELLKTAHPGVRAVLDAPLQMQRENDRLRVAAGRPGEADLEALLAAAAAAWPDGQGPVQTLRFEAGRLSLAAPGFGPEQLTQFRERLKGSGFAAELAEGRLNVTRAPAVAPGSA